MNNIISYKELNFMSFGRLNHEGVINLFTFKPYNFRSTQVPEYKIEDNYKKIQNDLDVKFKKIIKPNQMHTNNVRFVDENNINDDFLNVDGLITNLKEVALVTSLADCQGILLYDPVNKVIGNIHSGWRGTLNRIIENAINLMIDKYKCNPSNIEIYMTPSILQCCFEVDEDVKNQFIKEFRDIDINYLIKAGNYKLGTQKYYIDTMGVNVMLMLKLGIKKENIILSNMCTKCNKQYIHSHRGDGENSGRNIALICMKD